MNRVIAEFSLTGWNLLQLLGLWTMFKFTEAFFMAFRKDMSKFPSKGEPLCTCGLAHKASQCDGGR